MVDDHLRTSAQDIYAAGDVAAIHDPQTGKLAPRAQWYAAVLQGRIAATTMTGASLERELWRSLARDAPGRTIDAHRRQCAARRRCITTLTDSSRGSYRRMRLLDDRLVGYLSLGSVQPDSLAIKRIIDEGLSIRDIKKRAAARHLRRAQVLLAPAHLRGAAHGINRQNPVELAPRPLTTRKLEAPTTTAPALSPVSPVLAPTPPYIVSTPRPTAFEQKAPLIESDPQLARVLPSTGPLATPATAISGLTGPTIPHKLRNTDEDMELFAIPFVPASIDADYSPVCRPRQPHSAHRSTSSRRLPQQSRRSGRAASSVAPRFIVGG